MTARFCTGLLVTFALAPAPTTAQIPGPVTPGAPPCLHEIDRLVAADQAPGDRLGRAIAFDGVRAIVGAESRDGGSWFGIGGAYVFRLQGADWIEEAVLAPPRASTSQFGYAGTTVAASEQRALLGAPGDSVAGDDAGAVHVFVRQGTSWTREATLRAAETEAGDHFGSAVALDGDRALVGARGVTDHGSFAGAAYVFERVGGAWVERQKLLAPDGDYNDSFGRVALLAEDMALVGAPYAGARHLGKGAVYVFTRRPGGFELAQKLEASDASQNDAFGWSLALLGDRLAVGAFGHDAAGSNSGAVYVFENGQSGWEETAQLLPPANAGIGQMGLSVALGPDLVLAGAPDSTVGGLSSAGAALAFVRAPAGWIHLTTCQAPTPEESSLYAMGVAWAGGLGLVCAMDEDTPHVGAGAVHVLRLPAPSGRPGCACSGGPCSNDDATAGCANSTGSGALLLALGATEPDQVSLFGRGLPPRAYALFLQGSRSPPAPYGDGLSCLGASPQPLHPVLRKVGDDGLVGFGRCFGDLPITSGDPSLPGSGITLAYQLAYRDPAGPCGTSWNLSSALHITW